MLTAYRRRGPLQCRWQVQHQCPGQPDLAQVSGVALAISSIDLYCTFVPTLPSNNRGNVTPGQFIQLRIGFGLLQVSTPSSFTNIIDIDQLK